MALIFYSQKVRLRQIRGKGRQLPALKSFDRLQFSAAG